MLCPCCSAFGIRADKDIRWAERELTACCNGGWRWAALERGHGMLIDFALAALSLALHLARGETRIFVSSSRIFNNFKLGFNKKRPALDTRYCLSVVSLVAIIDYVTDHQLIIGSGHPSGRLTWCCCMFVMSGTEESDDKMMFCGSCGTAEVDDIKLKKCTACHSVRYCSVKCQRDHMPHHKKECKKRAAELRDEILFKQPESTHHGDCPICCLPLPIDPRKSTLMPCCSKIVCIGCDYANTTRELEGRSKPSCAFCRHPRTNSEEEKKKNYMKRIEANDSVAMCQMGVKCKKEGDYDGAFEYWTKAAALGNIGAHHNLSLMYREGQCVEKDEKKMTYHIEQAAIGGSPDARHNLGCYESERLKYERAVKHWIIAANLGYDASMKMVKEGFQMGLVSKDEFAAALRAHHAAVDATKSPQRVAAEKSKYYGVLSAED
eukprot:scaffold10323_cov163-Skeletonema_dohrnii-CCMP3373.AAC.2